MNPLCFVAMPFGVKTDPRTGRCVDFDAIFEMAIEPAIQQAGLLAIRADEERTGGIIHTPMFERLLLCDYVVADLTGLNANVYYELGLRHAMRPATTQCIFASHSPPTFDVNLLRCLPYQLSQDPKPSAAEAKRLRTELTRRLRDLRNLAAEQQAIDSPIFQLLPQFQGPDRSRIDSQAFVASQHQLLEIQSQIADASDDHNEPALQQLGDRLLNNADASDHGPLLAIAAAWRRLGNWSALLAWIERLPASISDTATIQAWQVHAHANLKQLDTAERICRQLIDSHGPSPEHLGLLGRLLKDRWQAARQAGHQAQATGFLHQAIAAYRRGYLEDPREPYPGINLVTLLDIAGDADSRRERDRILPVVRYAQELRRRVSREDYWALATALELAVLADDEAATQTLLPSCIAAAEADWQKQSTAGNLRLIHEARLSRGEHQTWLLSLIRDLGGEQILVTSLAAAAAPPPPAIATDDTIATDSPDNNTPPPEVEPLNATESQAQAATTTAKDTGNSGQTTPAPVEPKRDDATPMMDEASQPIPDRTDKNPATAASTPGPRPDDNPGLPPLSPRYRRPTRAYPTTAYTPRKGVTMKTTDGSIIDMPDRALRAKNFLEADYNLSNQEVWYDRKASSNRRWATRLGFLTVLAGAATAVVQLWTPSPPDMPPGSLHWTTILTALLGAAVVLTKGMERIWKFDDNWLAYRMAAEGIKRQTRLYINNAGPYVCGEEPAYRRYVENIENVIASEQNSFKQNAENDQ
jgi:tetratricopeptide (TPR) repeat protein